MSRTIIIGGGVVGLTTAYELSQSGRSVVVIDRQEVGQEASWAGAGMLPPCVLDTKQALKELSKRSARLWPVLSAELHELTGIDNGYHQCGALQISLNNSDDLQSTAEAWSVEDVPVEQLDRQGLLEHEPLLGERVSSGFFLPTMSQVRNPRHIKALKQACLMRGVEIFEQVTIEDFTVENGKISACTSRSAKFEGDEFVLAGGAWSGQLCTSKPIDLNVEVVPVRGQILLLKQSEQVIKHIIEDGPRYIVPRNDGHVLIGSTEENAGYIKETTDEGRQQLLDFATTIVPELKNAEIVRSWAGLRPRAVRGYPFIGPAPGIENLILATGHFRDGLMQSPATAKLVNRYLNHERPDFDATVLEVTSTGG